jgi:2-polyprenyl-3-methyl-5-hydroxy-6-metoxy-1,4-benzoquinol methylase
MPSVNRTWYERYWGKDLVPPDHDPLTGERVRRFLSVAEDKHLVLDLGCGSGRATRLLEEAGKKVIGLDISAEALRHASRFGGASSYVQADCDIQLPFADQSFEAVFCAEVIEHLLDPKSVVHECYRLLRPAGLLCVSTPYHAWIKNCVIAAVAFERHFDPIGPHIRFFTSASLRGLLAANGFRVRNTFCLGRFWPLWMNMLVSAEKVDNPLADEAPLHRSSASETGS